MSSAQQAVSADRRAALVDTWLFLVLLFGYVWWVIDPRLVFYSLGVFRPYAPFQFDWGWSFLAEQVVVPGGAVRYVAGWLTHVFPFRFLASLLLAGLAAVTCWSVDDLGRLFGRPRSRILRYVPSTLVLILYGGYAHPLRSLLSLTVTLLCFAMYARLSHRDRAWKLTATLALVMSLAIAFTCGRSGILFPILATVYELVGRRRWGVVAGGVAGMIFAASVASAAPAVGGIAGGVRAALLRDPGVPDWGYRWLLLLFAFFPAVLLGNALFLRRQEADSGLEGLGRFGAVLERAVGAARCRWICLGVALLAVAATAWYEHDSDAAVVLEIEAQSLHRAWPEVLQAADRMPYGVYNIRCNRNILLALYQTRRLGDRVFHYPQTPSDDFYRLPDKQKNPYDFFQESRLNFELGEVNRAERGANEALEATGQLPALLEHIAVINVVKDRPEAACVFLRVLQRKPFCGDRAARLLAQLRQDPRLESNPMVQAIRDSVTERDDVSTNVDVEASLLALLEKNPRNRMAFEFLMLHYLCVAEPGKVAANSHHFRDFGYDRLPRHIQEAIVVDSLLRTGRPPANDSQVTSVVLEDAEAFSRIMAGARGPEEASYRAVIHGLGGTYFYYYKFGVSGL